MSLSHYLQFEIEKCVSYVKKVTWNYLKYRIFINKNILMAGEFGLWRIDYDFSKFVREINIQLKYYARTIDRSRRFGP